VREVYFFTCDTIPSKFNAILCKVRRFSFCGLALTNLPIKVWDPPEGHHVDGVIGMDIIRHFNLHINSDTQKVTINWSHATNKALKKQ